MQENGRPKRCFGRVRFLLCPLSGLLLKCLKALEVIENTSLSSFAF